MDLKTLKKLRRSLPKKASRIIAERTGKSLSTVEKVLGGTRSNEMIIDAAILLAEKYKQNKLSRKEKIEAL